MFDLVLKNANIVTSDKVYKGHICIKNEKISQIVEPEKIVLGKSEIDANGKYVFPGVIDSHAHLNDPGFTWREDYEHGTSAAAVGGVTTIVDMPMQNEPALTTREILYKKEEAVSKNAYVDYCYWGGLVDYNFINLEELDEEGIVAFKSFIGPVSPDYVSLSMGQVREALQILQPLGARAGFHCEDFSIIRWEEDRANEEDRNDWRAFLSSRPISAELIATNGIIELAKEIGAKVHICHVSHPKVAEKIKQAQKEGVDIIGETCSHYLVFTEEDVLNNGSLFKCAPPLRTLEDREELWKYVNDGTLSCVGSDHSPCEKSEKAEEKHGVFGVWGGISGIQNLMQVMYSEGVQKRGYSPELIVRVLSEGPAKAFGIYGKKGAIKEGFDADLVIVDPEKEWEITEESLLYLNKISAFVGLKGKGLPECTILRGNVVARDGKIVGEKGKGNLVRKLKQYK